MLVLYSSRLHCFETLITAIGSPGGAGLLPSPRWQEQSVLPHTSSLAFTFTPPSSPGLRVHFPFLLYPTITASLALSSPWWNYVALRDRELPVKRLQSQKLTSSLDPKGEIVLLLLQSQLLFPVLDLTHLENRAEASVSQ